MPHPCITNLNQNNLMQNLIDHINAEHGRREVNNPNSVVGGWAHWMATADHFASFVALFDALSLALNAPTVPAGHYALGNPMYLPPILQPAVQLNYSSEMASEAAQVLAMIQLDGEEYSPAGVRCHPEYGYHDWLKSGMWDQAAVEKAEVLLECMRHALDR